MTMYLERGEFSFTIRTDEPRPDFRHVAEFFCAMSRIPLDYFRVTSIVSSSDGAGVYRHTCTGALIIFIETAK